MVVASIKDVRLIPDPATRVRQSDEMRDIALRTAEETFIECLYSARVDGLTWEALADASGLTVPTVKRKVYEYAAEHGYPRPTGTRTLPPITDYFSAVIRHGGEAGATRRHRRV